MDDDTHVDRSVNRPPDELRVPVFVVREFLAICFVGVWLLLFAGSLVTGAYALPFWYHCVAVGVLGYALGIGVGELVAKPPSKRAVARRVIGASRGEG